MGITNYHAKYYVPVLTKRCPSDSVEMFTAALVDFQVGQKIYDSSAREAELKKDNLVDEVEVWLSQKTSLVPLFHILWKIV